MPSPIVSYSIVREDENRWVLVVKRADGSQIKRFYKTEKQASNYLNLLDKGDYPKVTDIKEAKKKK